MRGTDQQQSHIFSYLSPEERVRKDHPLRTVRAMVDEVLQAGWPTLSLASWEASLKRLPHSSRFSTSGHHGRRIQSLSMTPLVIAG
jgi:hypothetical protein